MKTIHLPIEDQKKLEKLGVDAVVLFGSYATDTASETSDYDFGIVLNDTGATNGKRTIMNITLLFTMCLLIDLVISTDWTSCFWIEHHLNSAVM